MIVNPETCRFLKSVLVVMSKLHHTQSPNPNLLLILGRRCLLPPRLRKRICGRTCPNPNLFPRQTNIVPLGDASSMERALLEDADAPTPIQGSLSTPI